MTRTKLQILILMVCLVVLVAIYAKRNTTYTYHVYATYPVLNGYGKLDGISTINYEIVDYESYMKFKNELAEHSIKNVKGEQVTVETLTLLKK